MAQPALRGLPLKAGDSLHVALRDQGQLKREQKGEPVEGTCALRDIQPPPPEQRAGHHQTRCWS